MLDSANAAFWSNSLMWSLLSALIVMPALVLINDAATQSASRRAAAQNEAASARNQGAEPRQEQEPFVQEDSDEARTLWPEPQQPAGKPSQTEENRSSDRVRA